MPNNKILKEEAIFYLDMINSVFSPNFVPRFFKRKPYLLKSNRESTNYKRFINIYQKCTHVLNEQEKTILNKYYGVNEERQLLSPIAKEFNVSSARIQSIINCSESKIAHFLRDN